MNRGFSSESPPSLPEQAPVEAFEVPRAVPDTVVDDIHKAEAMAYAEGDFRTKAVANRTAVRADETLLEKQYALQDRKNRLDHPDQRLSRKERRQLRREQQVLTDEVIDGIAAGQQARQTTARQFEKDFAPVPGHRYYATTNVDDRAWFYDQQASRVGEWAGLLYDRPLSLEFKKAHPGIQFQPKALVRMEDDAERQARLIEYHDTPQSSDEIAWRVRRVFEASGGHTLVPTPSEAKIEKTQRMLRFADEGMAEKWQEIIEKVVNAAAEADEFYRALLEEAEVKPLREQLALTRKVLNDIRREVGLTVEDGEAEPQ